MGQIVIVRLFAAALACLLGGEPAALAGVTTPESSAAALTGTTPLAAGLDSALRAGLDEGLQGVALRVERGGAVVFDDAVGLAEIEDGTPLETSDRFRIY